MNPMKMLNRAAKLVEKSRHGCGTYALAAVALRADGTLVQSTNKCVRMNIPNGVLPPRIRSVHAEARVCKKIDRGAVVFVARVNRMGQWALAKPCIHCQNHLRSKKVRVAYFTVGPNEFDSINLE